MEQKKDMLDGQSNPYPEQEGLQQTNKDGKTILEGAHETDQLDQFKKNISDGGQDGSTGLQQGEGDKE